MTDTPLIRTYFQQPPADRALFLLFLADHDQRTLQAEIMDVLDVVQTFFIELLVDFHSNEPCSAASMAEFTTLIESLAEVVAAEG